MDVGTALVKGVILDMVIDGASVADLDRWISGIGCAARARTAMPSTGRASSIRSTTRRFNICDGDQRRPSFGAGSAAQVSLRLFGGYKDAFLYESSAGLGEVVVAPIYGALCSWGVKFSSFTS